MQEKTLEEEFDDKFLGLWLDGMHDYDEDKSYNEKETRDKLLAFISSREEKVREEGRKVGVAQEKILYLKKKREVITQYKEELLGKLDKRIEYFDKKTRQAQSGKDEHSKKLTIRWSAKRECLSEIKKLL